MFERNAWIREKSEYIDASVNPPIHKFRLTVVDTDPTVGPAGPVNARMIDNLTPTEVQGLDVGTKIAQTTDVASA